MTSHGKPKREPALGLNYPQKLPCLVFARGPSVLPEAAEQFRDFIHTDGDNPKSEFYIPKVVNSLIKSGKVQCSVLDCESVWYGVTYPDDKETVQQALRNFADTGKYPVPLF